MLPFALSIDAPRIPSWHKKLQEEQEMLKLFHSHVHKIKLSSQNCFNWAYLRLTPREYSSGESQKRGRITKCGHSQIRSLLVEAAFVMLTRTKVWSKPKAWALKICKKQGIRKASVALGRKLAVIMHRMLITQEPFIYGEEQEGKKVA